MVRPVGDALDRCRRRVQQTTHGPRGRTGDPLCAARRTLHAGADLLADRRHQRLSAPPTSSPMSIADVDRPGTGDGPTEAIDGRLEHLRGIALGLRALTRYITPPRDRRLPTGPSP